MRNLLKNQRIQTILSYLKPFALVLVIFYFLKFTGMLGSISYVANSALLKTGFFDIHPVESKDKAFDYNFSLKDLAGNKVDVNEFKGKVIFLNLWATWCGPCRAEMPAIQELYNKSDREKITFIMLSLDAEENQAKVVKYISDKAFTFPTFLPAGSIPEQLHVSSIPTTFVIGADGMIKMKKVGTSNYDTAEFLEFLNGLTK